MSNQVKRVRTVIEPSQGLASLKLGLLWEYRELLYFLVWRDIKVRYKQTLLGILWILIQPIVSIIVFSLLFGYLLEVPSGDVPYPIFMYSALLPWNYFAGSLTRSTTSVVNSSHLITKVYFPRLVIPVAGVISSLVDFGIAFLVLIGMMFVYGIQPTVNTIFLPGFVVLTMITAMGFGTWMSALNVRFRDVNYVLPFLVQIWLYLTPVVYGSNLLPQPFQYVLALNPMTGVVEGFRWALLGNYLADAAPPSELFPISVLIALIVLVSGIIFFRTTERSFADII
jgi:lipopolysaccharide transport system permease protein